MYAIIVQPDRYAVSFDQIAHHKADSIFESDPQCTNRSFLSFLVDCQLTAPKRVIQIHHPCELVDSNQAFIFVYPIEAEGKLEGPAFVVLA